MIDKDLKLEEIIVSSLKKVEDQGKYDKDFVCLFSAE